MILNTSVCKGVSDEARIFCESFSTLLTFIIFNTSVCKGVSGEVILPSKCVATFYTLKRFLSFADGDAFSKVILPVTPEPAHTWVRLLLCVLATTHVAAWPCSCLYNTTSGSTPVVGEASWSCRNPQGSWSEQGSPRIHSTLYLRMKEAGVGCTKESRQKQWSHLLSPLSSAPNNHLKQVMQISPYM